MVAKAMHERITSFEKVLIMGHRFADLDAVGAATGLCCAIKPLVKEAYVVVDPINNLAKPLIEHITDNNMTNYYITPQQGLEMLDFNTLIISSFAFEPLTFYLSYLGLYLSILHHGITFLGITLVFTCIRLLWSTPTVYPNLKILRLHIKAVLTHSFLIKISN